MSRPKIKRYRKAGGKTITTQKLKLLSKKTIGEIAEELGVSRISIYNACDPKVTVRNETKKLLEKYISNLPKPKLKLICRRKPE